MEHTEGCKTLSVLQNIQQNVLMHILPEHRNPKDQKGVSVMIQQETDLRLLTTAEQKNFCVSELWVVPQEDMQQSVM